MIYGNDEMKRKFGECVNLEMWVENEVCFRNDLWRMFEKWNMEDVWIWSMILEMICEFWDEFNLEEFEDLENNLWKGWDVDDMCKNDKDIEDEIWKVLWIEKCEFEMIKYGRCVNLEMWIWNYLWKMNDLWRMFGKWDMGDVNLESLIGDCRLWNVWWMNALIMIVTIWQSSSLKESLGCKWF